jgi:hypothetical protein
VTETAVAPRRDLDCDLCYPENHVECKGRVKTWSGAPEPTGTHGRCNRHRVYEFPECGGEHRMSTLIATTQVGLLGVVETYRFDGCDHIYEVRSWAEDEDTGFAPEEDYDG